MSTVGEARFYARSGCCEERLGGAYTLYVSNDEADRFATVCATGSTPGGADGVGVDYWRDHDYLSITDCNAMGRFVTLKMHGSRMLNLQEVEIYETGSAPCADYSELAHTLRSLGDIELSGGNDAGAVNLAACTGECDSDAQCAAGLLCFQREDNEIIPGCKGPGGGPDWDYCYDPLSR